jgi:oxaloacetate decarboxylase gamma subunit
MNELLVEGLQLMGVGMGVVFLFLGLLVGIITLVSTIIQKSEIKTAPSGIEPLNDDALLTLLSKAVKQYRADHHK